MIKRESNFELMKIVSMLFIIGWHFLMHGQIINNTIGPLNMFLKILQLLFIVHVNSFVLITGYFQYNKDFKLSKIISINNATWFYKSVILLIFILLGLSKFTKIEIFEILSPINYWNYWFIAFYIFLYLISPFLNKIIKSSSKIEHRNIIVSLFLIFSLLAYITNNKAVPGPNNYSIFNFILLYFIGSYIHKYNNNKNKKYNLLYITIILLIVCMRVLLYQISYNFIDSNNIIINYISTIIVDNYLSLSTPLVVIQSILYFIIFKNFKVNNKLINIIGSTTLGIYLIHDNNIIRTYMYKNIFKLNIINNNIIYLLPIYILIVFILCLLIEIIRKYIFKLFYNMNISKRIRTKITRFFSKNEINW